MCPHVLCISCMEVMRRPHFAKSARSTRKFHTNVISRVCHLAAFLLVPLSSPPLPFPSHALSPFLPLSLTHTYTHGFALLVSLAILASVGFQHIHPRNTRTRTPTPAAMYTLMSGLWRYYTSRDQYYILIVGLDNAGKTVCERASGVCV